MTINDVLNLKIKIDNFLTNMPESNVLLTLLAKVGMTILGRRANPLWF